MTSPSKETVRVEHTPTPWKIDIDERGNLNVRDRDGKHIIGSELDDAEFWCRIVHAVNRAHHFDDPVKALESAPSPKPPTDPVEYMDWYFKVRTATLSRIKTEG